MPIQLQHEDVTLEALRGRRCEAFLAVEDRSEGFLGPLYLQVDGAWHRFFLDAGVLFWQEGIAPGAEDELRKGEAHVDLGSALGVTGALIAAVEMHDSQLLVRFENGARLRLHHGPRNDGTQVLERKRARP